jgi:hypothetical protein
MDMSTTKTRKEGKVTKAIEKQTSKIPSDTFLWAAGASMASSLVCRIMGKNSTSTFLGQWAAPLLIMGLYNKLVKVEGHDKDDKGESDGLSQDKW